MEFRKSGTSGGWSRSAKHRPQPVRVEIITDDVIFTTGKSVIVQGQRKLKLNLYHPTTGQIVRADYSTTDKLTSFSGEAQVAA